MSIFSEIALFAGMLILGGLACLFAVFLIGAMIRLADWMLQ